MVSVTERGENPLLFSLTQGGAGGGGGTGVCRARFPPGPRLRGSPFQPSEHLLQESQVLHWPVLASGVVIVLTLNPTRTAAAWNVSLSHIRAPSLLDPACASVNCYNCRFLTPRFGFAGLACGPPLHLPPCRRLFRTTKTAWQMAVWASRSGGLGPMPLKAPP